MFQNQLTAVDVFGKAAHPMQNGAVFLRMDPFDSHVEYVKSNKGGIKVIHKGYMYTVHKKNAERVRWRCCQRALRCKGSISTGFSGTTVNVPHNHIPDLHAVEMARTRLVNDDDSNDCSAENSSPLLEKTKKGVKNDSTSDVLSVTTCGKEQSEKIIKFYNVRTPESYLDSNVGSSSNQNLNMTKHDNVFKFISVDNDHDESSAGRKPIIKPRTQTQKTSRPSSTVTKVQQPSPDSEVCLRWNSHHSNMQSVFPCLMDREQYVDVTLAVEGNFIKCHKLILSSCSPYFDEMLMSLSPMQYPVIFLKDMKFWHIKALVDFMYKGEVNVDQNKLESLLQAAEVLQIKGLAGKSPKKEEIEESVEEVVPCKGNPNSPMRDDEKDEDYTPALEYRKRYAAKKAARKRKAATPIDVSQFSKQLPINLGGTKSRPNIKQPKFYDPDYPDLDSSRCVSPPKADVDSVFHIDNIKIEPIDIDSPHSPYYDMENAMSVETKLEDNVDLPKKCTSKIIKEPKNNSPEDEVVGKKTYIKVRNLPTTESVLKKFTTNTMTSILKKSNSECPIIITKTESLDRQAVKTKSLSKTEETNSLPIFIQKKMDEEKTNSKPVDKTNSLSGKLIVKPIMVKPVAVKNTGKEDRTDEKSELQRLLVPKKEEAIENSNKKFSILNTCLLSKENEEN